MSLGSKKLQTGSFVHHLTSRSRRGSKLRRTVIAGLMLTSMVDMFSLLVIFLLQSFSNSPEVVTLQKGLVLPSAMSTSASKDAPVLAVSNEDVILDQINFGNASIVAKNPTALAKKLFEIKQSWETAHPNEEFAGDIHLQADKGLPSSLVTQFVQVLVNQGFSSVNLAVVGASR